MAEKTATRDWVTPVALVGGAVMLGAGAYMILKKPGKEGFQDLKIVSYTNRAAGKTVMYPEVLDVAEGDYIDVTYQFSYLGDAVDRTVAIAVGPKCGEMAAASDRWSLEMPDTQSRKTFELTSELQVEAWNLDPGLYSLDVEIWGLTKVIGVCSQKPVIRVGVAAGKAGFVIGQPSVSPNPANLGEQIKITCPITSQSAIPQTINVVAKVQESSIWPGPGDTLSTLTSPAYTIKPGETHNFVFTDTAKGKVGKKFLAHDPGLKDITVDVRIGGQVVGSDSFDDVFFVAAGTSPLPSGEGFILTLRSDPIYGGWITVDPEQDSYSAGQIVRMEAHVIWPSRFTYWDVDGEYLDWNPAINFAVMADHVLTAHFTWGS